MEIFDAKKNNEWVTHTVVIAVLVLVPFLVCLCSRGNCVDPTITVCQVARQRNLYKTWGRRVLTVDLGNTSARTVE